MRIVLIIGSHPRHLYIADKIAQTGFLSGIVLQGREPMIMKIPEEVEGDLRDLYEFHFKLRSRMEEKYFGHVEARHLLEQIPHIELKDSEINGIKTEMFIKEIGADTLLSYGPGLLKNSILDLCKDRCFNIHGGLSPWYKGAATMFWPFYFLEPHYVGTTIHRIVNRIDGGDIIHQVVPKLEYGDCMHAVACKTIVATGDELGRVTTMLNDNLEGVPQKKNGKLFLDRDWRPEHLRLIYQTYHDQIVDAYLDGKIGKNSAPELVRLWK